MRSGIYRHPLVQRLLRPMPLIVLAAVLCFSGWFVIGSGGLWDCHHLRERQAWQRQQIAELTARRDYVKQQLADLKKKDERALEQAARDFGLVAPGETVYEFKIEPAPKN